MSILNMLYVNRIAIPFIEVPSIGVVEVSQATEVVVYRLY
jgi:hypothetical protein